MEELKKVAPAATEAEKTFLPTVEEINEMHEIEFKNWIDHAFYEIPQRKIMRDPLYHLKKAITEIVNDDNKSLIEKENAIYGCIKDYYKLIQSHQSQSKKLV